MAEGERPGYRRVLSNRSALFLWIGELVSQSGDYVFAIALPWLVLLQTNSAFDVSITRAVSWVPLLLSPVAGVYVDRANRRTSVVFGNLAQGAAAAALAMLYAFGALSLLALLALVFVIYFFDLFVSTAIESILPRMVESKGELGAINALFSISSSTKKIAGYVVGGTVVALVGVVTPIFYDGATFFFAALVTLAFVSSLYGRISMPVAEPSGPRTGGKGFGAEFAEGVGFVRNNRLFFELTVVLFAVNFFVSGPSALIAPYVADALHLGSLGFGVVVSSTGAGGIVGAYAFGKSNAGRYAGRLFFVMVLLIGLSLLIVGLVPSFFVALPLFFVIGLSSALIDLPIMTLLQAKVPNEILGRVLAVVNTFGAAAAPVAAVVAGSLALTVSTQAIFAYFGLGTVLILLPFYALFRELRSASY